MQKSIKDATHMSESHSKLNKATMVSLVELKLLPSVLCIFRMESNVQPVVPLKRRWAAPCAGGDAEEEVVSVLQKRTRPATVEVFEERRMPWSLFSTINALPSPQLKGFRVVGVTVQRVEGERVKGKSSCHHRVSMVKLECF